MDFQTTFDGVPAFWNFLLGLKQDDLIAELVANDLDQGATRTIISFEQGQLVCEGNGNPVDSDGWKRLRIIQGAGVEVLEKRGKIGVKNHGLKTAFKIGDEIVVSSDGQTITQTLYAKGRDNPPHPGASESPYRDQTAPTKGCRIIVKYRDTKLETTVGDRIELDVTSDENIASMFSNACGEIPEQFAGIVSPEIVPRYEIALRHWEHGEARFMFSCARVQKRNHRIEVFHRRCVVNGTLSPLPAGLRECVARRLIPATGALEEKAAEFYRRENRVFVEVSWRLNGRGKPQADTGRFRYPIGYPHDSDRALTGLGASFSAPITSDAERHGPASGNPVNDKLRAACESLLVDAMAGYAIPHWGAAALDVLPPDSTTASSDARARSVLSALVAKNAIPSVTWRQAQKLLNEGRSKHRGGVARRPAETRRYDFIIPKYKDSDIVSPPLSLIAPRIERQIDPRVSSEIVRLLANGNSDDNSNVDGFCETFITFDEGDAIYRAQGSSTQFFDACPDRNLEFSQPVLARAYLDVILAKINQGEHDFDVNELIKNLLLPDTSSNAVSFRDLYLGVDLPDGIPGASLPPLLHQDIATHPLLRKSKWRVQRYTMEHFLNSGILDNADENTRGLFWNWLRKNPNVIKKSQRGKLADFLIWSDSQGGLRKLSDLCEPKSARAFEGLSRPLIHRPHKRVLRLPFISVDAKKRLAIRRAPTDDELITWIHAQTEQFGLEATPDSETLHALNRFESDLVILMGDADTARKLSKLEVGCIPACAKDGVLRCRGELVLPSPRIDNIALPHKFVLGDTTHAATLDKFAAVLPSPTTAMLVDAFVEDATNIDALQPRLQEFILANPDDDDMRRIADMPIIPVNNERRAPNYVALKGSPDYWGGEWKTRLSVSGLSHEDQDRYRKVGVLSATPTDETSRSFFLWLADKGEDVLHRHIAMFCAIFHALD